MFTLTALLEETTITAPDYDAADFEIRDVIDAAAADAARNLMSA